MTTPADYERSKAHYRSVEIAEGYDSWRYDTPRGQRRNRRDLAAVARAIAETDRRGDSITSALDMPTGTGRLVPLLRERSVASVGADISLEMLRVARRKFGPTTSLYQGNAEQMPHADGAFSAVFAIRFVFHLDRATRVRVFREMRRVSRRWLVLDVRHRYNVRAALRSVAHRLGLRPSLPFRYSRREVAEELRESGLATVRIFPSRRYVGFFSDKWIVLAEKVRTDSESSGRSAR